MGPRDHWSIYCSDVSRRPLFHTFRQRSRPPLTSNGTDVSGIGLTPRFTAECNLPATVQALNCNSCAIAAFDKLFRLDHLFGVLRILESAKVLEPRFLPHRIYKYSGISNFLQYSPGAVAVGA